MFHRKKCQIQLTNDKAIPHYPDSPAKVNIPYETYLHTIFPHQFLTQ